VGLTHDRVLVDDNSEIGAEHFSTGTISGVLYQDYSAKGTLPKALYQRAYYQERSIYQEGSVYQDMNIHPTP
jgi:hypothetical protein